METDLMKTLGILMDTVHPERYKKTIESQGKGVFLWDSVIIVMVISLIVMIANMIANFILLITNNIFGFRAIPSPFAFLGQIDLIFGIGSLLFATVLGFIAFSAVFMVNQYLIFSLSRMLKGKGDINNQAYALALVAGGSGLILAVLNLINIIPYAGETIWALGSIAVLIWFLYLSWFAVKKVHALSDLNAAIVIIVPVLFWVVAAAVLGFVLTLLGMSLGIFSALVSATP